MASRNAYITRHQIDTAARKETRAKWRTGSFKQSSPGKRLETPGGNVGTFSGSIEHVDEGMYVMERRAAAVLLVVYYTSAAAWLRSSYTTAAPLGLRTALLPTCYRYCCATVTALLLCCYYYHLPLLYYCY